MLQCRRRQQYHNDDDEPLPSRQKNSRTTGGHIRLRWLKDCRSRDLAQPDSVESVAYGNTVRGWTSPASGAIVLLTVFTTTTKDDVTG